MRNTSKRGTENGREEDEVSSGDSDGADEDQRGASQPKKNGRMGVEDFMKGGFVDGMEEGGSDDDGEDEDLEEEDASLQDIEDLSDEEEDHAQDLAKLAKKDPEFFKYLQENDQELLDFGIDGTGEDEDMEEEVSAVKKGKRKVVEKQAEIVTSAMLKGWQKSILQVSCRVTYID